MRFLFPFICSRSSNPNQPDKAMKMLKIKRLMSRRSTLTVTRSSLDNFAKAQRGTRDTTFNALGALKYNEVHIGGDFAEQGWTNGTVQIACTLVRGGAKQNSAALARLCLLMAIPTVLSDSW